MNEPPDERWPVYVTVWVITLEIAGAAALLWFLHWLSPIVHRI